MTAPTDAQRPAGLSLGLVSSVTTDTAVSNPVVAIKEEVRRFGRLRRTLLTSARLMVDSWRGTRAQWWMVTLTYADVDDWRPGQLSTALKALRMWCKRAKYPIRYVWVFENASSGQRAGGLNPHYHVLVQLPYRVDVPKFDEKGWWKYGLTQRVKALRAVGYVAKYASKAGAALEWFKGARCHGVSGLLARDRAVLSFWRAPRWARSAFGFCDANGTLPEAYVQEPLRRVRQGFVWQQTGEFVRCPVVCRLIDGAFRFVARDEVTA